MNKDLKQLELARIALESGIAMIKVTSKFAPDRLYTVSKINIGCGRDVHWSNESSKRTRL